MRFISELVRATSSVVRGFLAGTEGEAAGCKSAEQTWRNVKLSGGWIDADPSRLLFWSSSGASLGSTSVLSPFVSTSPSTGSAKRSFGRIRNSFCPAQRSECWQEFNWKRSIAAIMVFHTELWHFRVSLHRFCCCYYLAKMCLHFLPKEKKRPELQKKSARNEKKDPRRFLGCARPA